MENFIGEIRLFAGTYAPEGWHICDGSLMSISDYEALFSLLGTVYGGDGRLTFGLPDLQGRIPVGTGKFPTSLNNYVLGAKGGTKASMVDQDELPPHSHTMSATTANATTGDPTNNFLASSNGNGYADGVNLYINIQGGVLPTGATIATLDTDSVDQTGGNHTHPNMQPYICINYIIALTGLYPQQ